MAQLAAGHLLWSQEILHAVNATGVTGEVSEIEIAKSQRIASINCATVFSGVRLVVSAGELVARATYQKWAPLAAAAE
jgi:hypothetical protein